MWQVYIFVLSENSLVVPLRTNPRPGTVAFAGRLWSTHSRTETTSGSDGMPSIEMLSIVEVLEKLRILLWRPSGEILRPWSSRDTAESRDLLC